MKRILFLLGIALVGIVMGCSQTPNEPLTNYSVQHANNVVHVRTDYQGDHWSTEEVTHVLRSHQAMRDYYDAFTDDYDFENSYQDLPSFEALLDVYDASFFEGNFIVLLVLEEPSGSYVHQVTGLSVVEGELVIELRRTIPEIGTTDMAGWHIVIELAQGDLEAFESIRVEPTTVKK